MLRTTMLLSIIMLALTFGNASNSYAMTIHKKPLKSWGYEEQHVSFPEAARRLKDLWANKVFLNKTNNIQAILSPAHKVNNTQYDFTATQIKPGMKHNLRADYKISLFTQNKRLFLSESSLGTTPNITTYAFIGLKNGGFAVKSLKPESSIFIVAYYLKNKQGLSVITQYFKSITQGAEKLEYVEMPYKHVSLITPN